MPQRSSVISSSREPCFTQGSLLRFCIAYAFSGVFLLAGGAVLVLDVPSLSASAGPGSASHPTFGHLVETVASGEIQEFVSAVLTDSCDILVAVNGILTSVRIS